MIDGSGVSAHFNGAFTYNCYHQKCLEKGAKGHKGLM